MNLRLRTAFAAAFGAALAALPFAAGADDIDIFTGASGGAAANPRILIVLDNTSNWSRQSQKWPGGVTQGGSEVNAIKSVLAGLDTSVSVGLMEFVTGGNANDDGGFIRSAIRPMTPENKTTFASQLTTIYNDISGPTEKHSANTPYGNLMYDVYNYFSGSNSYSPGGVLASKADSGGYSALYTKFASPLTSDNICGKSFVIFIGNPNQSGPSADSAANTTALKTVNGVTDASGNLVAVPQLGLPSFSSTSATTSTQIGTTACYGSAKTAAADLSKFAACTATSDSSSATDGCAIGAAIADSCTKKNENQYQVLFNTTTVTNTPGSSTTPDSGPRNADEWARVLYERGIPISGSTIRPSVVTYTIDVYNAQPDATQTALLSNMAKYGGGKYFAAKNEQAIIDALKQIIIEIQSVNTTFASTSLPVNATNRSENENQVYIGMFRPDPDARPRWFGNLKRYKLITSGGSVTMGDVAGTPALNPITGFVTPCATSFWTFDSGTYWNNVSVSPDAAGSCSTTLFNKYSDAPDGPQVEKGAVAEVLRQGNVAANGTHVQTVNRNMYTVGAAKTLVAFDTASSGLGTDTVRFIRGEDVNDEKGTGLTTTTRPSIHGDVVHSRPLPVNYGSQKGVTVYYGANDGTFHAVNADTGVERWSLVAPEFYSRLARLQTNSPRVSYPGLPAGITPTPTQKDYFFDGSTGLYQNADNSKVWIFPSMRRGGRMVYAIDVTSPDKPVFKWKAGCPNLNDDTGCTTGMSAIGQTWSMPSVAFIKGYSKTAPIVAFGGGYSSCEDDDSVATKCTTGAEKGGAIFILDADTGTVLASFTTSRAVAGDVAMVDIDNDGMPDYLYAADTGGNLYRVDFVDGWNTKGALAKDDWKMRMVAQTKDGGRKFLFAPSVLPTKGYVYVAIGSGDREHPLYDNYPSKTSVVNRFYVYKDSLSVKTGAVDLDKDLADRTLENSCDAPKALPTNDLLGWHVDLNRNGTGEQVVTSALIVTGMVTFSTNRPIPPAAGTCSTTLGEARGYWLNLLNGSGAINVSGTCGGARSAAFIGGGLPPSPVLAVSVPVDGKATTVTIGAIDKNSSANAAVGNNVADVTAATGSQLAPGRVHPLISSKRKRSYTYVHTE
jgi:type IV pilus assembly protein PilY1